MRLLRPLETQGSIRWLSRDLAVGRPEGETGWSALRARGVRAVVDLSSGCSESGDQVRQQGMRYLRLSVDRTGMPEAEELHIVTSWVLARTRDAGPVLIHDPDERGNDALLACAVYVKNGGSLEKALAQMRSVAGFEPTALQLGLLHQFVAQRAVAINRR